MAFTKAVWPKVAVACRGVFYMKAGGVIHQVNPGAVIAAAVIFRRLYRAGDSQIIQEKLAVGACVFLVKPNADGVFPCV